MSSEEELSLEIKIRVKEIYPYLMIIRLNRRNWRLGMMK